MLDYCEVIRASEHVQVKLRRNVVVDGNKVTSVLNTMTDAGRTEGLLCPETVKYMKM